MSGQEPCRIDVGGLRPRPKDRAAETAARIDEAGEGLGFVEREPRRRGRPKSPRTGQVHARVMPGIPEETAGEARQRGVRQGVPTEEAWELYRRSRERGLVTDPVPDPT